MLLENIRKSLVFRCFLGAIEREHWSAMGQVSFFCYTTMIYFSKYLQAAVVSCVHAGQPKRFRNVVF